MQGSRLVWLPCIGHRRGTGHRIWTATGPDFTPKLASPRTSGVSSATIYTAKVVAVCRKMDVRYSITLGMHRGVRRLIEAIPEEAWTPIPYWIEGGADVAEISYTPFADRPSTGWG